MIFLKTDEEVELIRKSSLLVAKVHAEMAKMIKPGVTTLELDAFAEEFICDFGGVPAFKGYNGFPNTLCMSPDNQVVHGIPNNNPLENGSILSIDCGVLMNDYYGDSAYTYAVGEINQEKQNLLDVTKQCLLIGIEQAVVGNRVGDISHAIQHHAEAYDYGVVRELVGHGIGTSLHESPEVPNYGIRGRGPKLQNGLVIAIEPMINMGVKQIRQHSDGWTITTADNKPSAHFEHTVVVRQGKADVLSSFEWIEQELNNK
ncbi:MAG: type I methionyl aminopeptidase [Bacteroidota bacterium]|nr:type I methionyl aminopeptidase [Bacteroidota bacterium]